MDPSCNASTWQGDQPLEQCMLNHAETASTNMENVAGKRSLQTLQEGSHNSGQQTGTEGERAGGGDRERRERQEETRGFRV